jgi:hypothetical protein
MKVYLAPFLFMSVMMFSFRSDARIVLSNASVADEDVVTVSKTSWVMTSFTVDSSTDYTLSSITLSSVDLDLSSNSGLRGDIFFKKADGSRGDWVKQLNAPTGGNNGEAFFSAAANTTLYAGTNYYFALQSSSETSFKVGYSDDTSTDSGSSWLFGSEGYRLQEDGTLGSATGNQVKMKIEAIPEPAVFALISLVGLGMIVARRFRL